MKERPPFILYYNNSKSLSSRISSSKLYRNNKNPIFSRIPQDVLENSQEIRSIIFKEKKPFYDIINVNKKPNKIRLYNNMPEDDREKVENINSFRNDIYEFNQEENDLMDEVEKVQKENNFFGNKYHQLQKNKSKYSTGTYLDHDYLIPIANRYISKGIKVPKMNSDKSVFSGNPLILSGSELEDFIVYNLGDRKKGTQFLKRMDEIMERKIKGNNMIPAEEMKKLKELEKPEYQKGYIPPEELIQQLQEENKKSKETIKNIKNLENFFKSGKTDSNKLININPNNSSLFENSEKNKSKIKIRIKKNLPSLKKYNNNSILNINNNSTNISLIDTLSPSSPKIFLNKSNINKTNINSINSAKTKDKSTLFIFSRLPSSTRNHNNKLLDNEESRFSIISNLYKEQSKRKSNLPNISYLIKNIKGRFSNININNKTRSSLQNNSADAKNKVFSRNYLNLDNFSEEKIEEKTNSDESEKSEIELIHELDRKPKIQLKKKFELNISDNNSINDITKINDNNKEKIKARKKILKKLSIKFQKNEGSLKNAEKIFNMILKNKSINTNKKEIEKFLEERGFDTSRSMNNKLLFNNMDMVEKGMQKKVLQEELKIRGELINTKYKRLLEKDDLFSKQIEENNFKFKKLIYEKNVDKNQY